MAGEIIVHTLTKFVLITILLAGLMFELFSVVRPIKSAYSATPTPPTLAAPSTELTASAGTPEVGATPPSPTSTAAILLQPATILIPDSNLQIPVDQKRPDGSRANFADFMKDLTVYADGTKCATISLTDTTSRVETGKVLQVGQPDQPAACAHDGAKLTFIDAFGRPLVTEFIFKSGSKFVLSNLAPRPLETGGSVQPPNTGDGPLGEGSASADSALFTTRTGVGAAAGALLGLCIAGGVVLKRKSQHG